MMITFIVFLIIVITFRSILKVYKQVPLSELSRQSKKDKSAKKLFAVAKYGIHLDVVVGVLLSFFIGLSLFFIKDASVIWFLTIALLMNIYVFVWPKNNKSLSLSKYLAIWIAPLLSRILKWSSPILSLLLPLTIRQPKTSPIYEPSDLAKFLSEQKGLRNSRISHSQLDELIEVLQKSDRHIQNLMIKRKKMKVLKPDDAVGPILLSELHESKQTAFIVEDSEKGVVGVVKLDALSTLREGGQVDRIMDRELYFVHKDWLLGDVTKAYLETKADTFLVVDDTEKIVGIITLEQVIKASLGTDSDENKLNYADTASVSTSSK